MYFFSSSCLETACYKLRVVSMFFVKTSLLWELVHAMCDMFTQNSPYYTGKIFINPFNSGIFAEKTPFKASRAVFFVTIWPKRSKPVQTLLGFKTGTAPWTVTFCFLFFLRLSLFFFRFVFWSFASILGFILVKKSSAKTPAENRDISLKEVRVDSG